MSLPPIPFQKLRHTFMTACIVYLQLFSHYPDTEGADVALEYIHMAYIVLWCVCVCPYIVPSAAPEDVAVEAMNNTVMKVSWNRVHKDKLHGRLGGYKVILHPCPF